MLVPPDRPVLLPHRTVTVPWFSRPATSSPVAATARSPYPSALKSAAALTSPNRSSASSAPGTPGLFWLMYWILVPGPFAVPKVTLTAPPGTASSAP